MENKLKFFRNQNNLSQEDVANKLYVTRQTISNWENTNHLPPLTALNDLANLYNVTISNLIGEEEVIMEKKHINFMALIGVTIFTIIFIPFIAIFVLTFLFTGWVISASFAGSPIIALVACFLDQGFSWFQLGMSLLLMIIGIPLCFLMYIITKYVIKISWSYFKYSFGSVFYKISLPKKQS